MRDYKGKNPKLETKQKTGLVKTELFRVSKAMLVVV